MLVVCHTDSKRAGPVGCLVCGLWVEEKSKPFRSKEASANGSACSQSEVYSGGRTECILHWFHHLA